MEFQYSGAISRPQEWFNRSWAGQVGRVETFLRPREMDCHHLEELLEIKLLKKIQFSMFVVGKELLMA